MKLDDYRQPGFLTALGEELLQPLAVLEPAPHSLCRAAQGLIILPDDAVRAGLPTPRLEERNVRSAAEILRIALDLSDAPLDQPRPEDRRVVGTCRHFAVLACALLRAESIPARARCGFATYFQPGKYLDHWVTEYWDEASLRWVRIDSEILGSSLVPRPDDLGAGEFLSGGEAWRVYRAGVDGMSFGVDGTNNWGPAEIVGNVIRDLAALNKVEMLPWDEWGPMQACYEGGVDPVIERRMDEIAEACAADSFDVVALYEDLRVPDEIIR